MNPLAEKIAHRTGSEFRLGGKYLTFALGKEEYGIGILKIREIMGVMPVTPLPRSPDFVKGVINLRGKVIPVMDLRLRFGMGLVEETGRTCIIVIEAQALHMEKCWKSKNCNKVDCPAYGSPDMRCWMVSGTYCRNGVQGSYHEKIKECKNCDYYRQVKKEKSVITMGIVVDSVSEVLNIKDEDIQETPGFGASLNTDYILGMARMDGGVKILLDIDKVLRPQEMGNA